MIIGNPEQFALIIEKVDAWSDTNFHNGILNIYIGGKLFPNRLTCSTLNTDLFHLLMEPNSALINPKNNEKLFTLNKCETVIELMNITFPDDVNVDNDYSYKCDFLEMSDFDDYVFIISDGNRARIIAVNLQNINKDNIFEVFISLEELSIIIGNLRVFYESLE